MLLFRFITRIIFSYLNFDEFGVIKLTICCRKILGENLESCSIEELHELESKLEHGLRRIRGKKVSHHGNYFSRTSLN